MNQKRQVLLIKTGTILKGSVNMSCMEKYIKDANFADTGFSYTMSLISDSLSERGKSLMKVLDQLCSWGEENRLTD